MEFVRQCKKCNRKVPAREVRMQPDGSYLCFACAGYAPQAAGSSRSANTPHEVPKDERPADKIRFMCLKCKYVFSLKEGHSKRCPYCASANIEEKQGEAQRLIDMHVQLRDEE